MRLSLGTRPSALVTFLCALALACAASAQAPKFRLGPSAELNQPGQKKASEEAQKIANRALAEFAKNDLDTARRDFLKVLELAPGNLPTLINLGLLEYRAKKYDDAEKFLKRVVREAPESGLGWLVLGVVYYEANKLDAALAALAQAVYYEPKDARAHHYLGVTIGRKGWYLGAEDEMRKAIELAPDYAEAHFNLAVFYLQRSPPAIELARRHYQQALDLGAAPDAQVEKSLRSDE
ncbi:MAG TPA: tetratricopeptide repeat protein [Chthoniobacteraceae bacterium]|nr:tetratricopeptide repeat protein [Chthoniobacteraceae bacterium]